ncbi:hypothetical protein [Ureibacillus sp. FSL K6-0165]|uniref:hypothetical protein n=1 Tax=Ureibacillus sp. FSL K6-0165 TaxID=2954606 RepID=UPI0030FA18DB
MDKNKDKLSDIIKREVEQKIANQKPLNPDKFTWKENEVIIHKPDTKNRPD